MRCAIWLLGCLLGVIFPVRAHNQSSFSLFSFYKNGMDFQSADFLDPSSEYEVIRDKADNYQGGQGKRNTLKICLKNGLEVFLISDPKVVQSAAALSVETGSWNDPIEAPGLAHFVEHLLFMGTGKYPSESDFAKYVGERGGEYNAFTSHDRTIFGFCLNHEGLEGGLDRFSHFFIDPLFSLSTIQREKHAVHHEFEDHIENDAIRIWRVLKETGNPLHPNAIFSCGNLDSLANVTQQEIQEWFAQHYTAPRMHLVVLSSHPLRELSQMVVKYFSAISAEEGIVHNYDPPFTSEKQKGRLIYINPSYKSRSLQLIWEVPREFAQGFSMRPMQLVQLALDHKGEQSLGKILEKEQLATEMAIDYWRVEKDHVLFLIEVSLTKKGVKQVDEVIHTCFQAMHKLQEEGIPYYLYEQLCNSERLLSEYNSPQNVFDFAIDTAVALMDEELETYPQKSSAPSSFDGEFLRRFIESLIPENCLFFLMAPQNETQVQMSAFEKWMGTPYTIRDIPAEKLAEWKNAQPHPHLEVRSMDLDVKNEEFENPWDDESDLSETTPIVISSSAHIRLAYIEDTTSNSLSAFFCISNPKYKSSAKHAAMSTLYVSYLQEALGKFFPKEERDALSWILIPGEAEIYIFLKAFGEQKGEKMQNFFARLRDLVITEREFEEIRVRYLEAYHGDPAPLEYAQAIVQSALVPSFYSQAEIFNVLSEITYAEFLAYSQKFFDKVYTEGIFYGNISEAEASEYWRLIDTHMKGVSGLEGAPSEGPSLLHGITWEKPVFIEQQTHRKGNALVLVLNVGPINRESWAVQKILSQLLQEEFFDELRTKQQTAYRVYSWVEPYQDVLLQYLAIQSSTHSPKDLLHRVERFLNDFVSNFTANVSRERMNLIRHMLITAFKRQKQNLQGIEENRWLFAIIETLKSVTYERVYKVAEETFSQHNKKRVAVMVEGQSGTQGHSSNDRDCLKQFDAL